MRLKLAFTASSRGALFTLLFSFFLFYCLVFDASEAFTTSSHGAHLPIYTNLNIFFGGLFISLSLSLTSHVGRPNSLTSQVVSPLWR
jgi:hypothetical protein